MIQKKMLCVGDDLDIKMLFPDAKAGDVFRIDIHTQYPNENIQSNVIEVKFFTPPLYRQNRKPHAKQTQVVHENQS